jgi:RHS repeat-associated protein
MREGESYYYYHNDHLGTPQKLTLSNGAVIWSAKYTAFGEAIVDPNSMITNNLRFPGQYQDEESGLHYNYHRYYEPRSGRYLTADPIGLGGGINLFIYVLNNPINWTDYYGLIEDDYYLETNSSNPNPPNRNMPEVDWRPEQITRHTQTIGHIFPRGEGEYAIRIHRGQRTQTRPAYNPTSLNRLMCMTRELGEGFDMTEGVRTEQDNQILLNSPGVRAAQNSPHLGGTGGAFDIAAHGNVALQNRIMCAAAKCGFSRCHPYTLNFGGHVHVDVAPSPGWQCPNPNNCNARRHVPVPCPLTHNQGAM